MADHPGDALSKKAEDVGWDRGDVAFVVGMSVSEVTRIANRRRPISAAMAKKLADAFGTTPSYWMDLQIAYDMRGAIEPDPLIRLKGRISNHFPLREMIDRGWVEDADTCEDLERNFSSHFDCANLAEVSDLVGVQI